MPVIFGSGVESAADFYKVSIIKYRQWDLFIKPIFFKVAIDKVTTKRNPPVKRWITAGQNFTLFFLKILHQLDKCVCICVQIWLKLLHVFLTSSSLVWWEASGERPRDTAEKSLFCSILKNAKRCDSAESSINYKASW